MSRNQVIFAALAVGLALSTAQALDIDRRLVDIRWVEYPEASIVDLDFGALRAEAAPGGVSIRDPILRTTSTVCVPEGSDNVLRDAVEVETFYYEIPYEAGAGVLVVRDADDQPVFTSWIDALGASERYGHGDCRFWRESALVESFAGADLRDAIEAQVRLYTKRVGLERIDQAFFFQVDEARIPIYDVTDRKRDYSDLHLAASRAEAGYRALNRAGITAEDAGRTDLERAAETWADALKEADLANKNARINRRVAARLHENLGVARMTLGEPEAAVIHLEKALQLATVSVSRTGGTGNDDLLKRAKERARRSDRNREIDSGNLDVEGLMFHTDRFRGHIPLVLVDGSELTAFEEEHIAFFASSTLGEAAREVEQRDAAIADGRVNRYDSMVSHTATQGFVLFITKYQAELTDFPPEITQIRHLNRLRLTGHGFTGVPETIDDLAALEVLNLANNAIADLPRRSATCPN